MLTVHKCSDTGLFGYLTNSAFCSLWYQEKKTFQADTFVQSIPNFMQIFKMQKKIEEIFLDMEIFEFELVALETRFYWERILVIGCEYVNKQSPDFRRC